MQSQPHARRSKAQPGMQSQMQAETREVPVVPTQLTFAAGLDDRVLEDSSSASALPRLQALLILRPSRQGDTRPENELPRSITNQFSYQTLALWQTAPLFSLFPIFSLPDGFFPLKTDDLPFPSLFCFPLSQLIFSHTWPSECKASVLKVLH